MKTINLIKKAVFGIILFATTSAMAAECSSEGICIGLEYYTSSEGRTPLLVTVVGIDSAGTSYIVKHVVDGRESSGWKKSNLAKTTGCSDEGICIGKKYYTVIETRTPLLVTVVGIDNAGTSYIVKYEVDGRVSRGWKKSNLAKTTGCSDEGICIGKKYYAAIGARTPILATVVGIDNTDTRYTVQYEVDGRVSQGWKKSELAKIAGQDYGFSDFKMNGGLDNIEDALKDLSKISYKSKSQYFDKLVELLKGLQSDESRSMQNYNKYNARVFIANAMSPLIENNTSEIFETKVKPEFKKFKDQLNTNNGIQSLSDIPFSVQTRSSALYMMQLALNQIKPVVVDQNIKGGIDKVIAKIGTALSDNSKSKLVEVLSSYSQVSSNLSDVRVLPASRDFMIIADSINEYLRANFGSECVN